MQASNRSLGVKRLDSPAARGKKGSCVLTVSADGVSEGLRPNLAAGFLVRTEVGSDLKSLLLWSLERGDSTSGLCLVIRDGHTLKKKVSWRPSSSSGATGDHPLASSITFVPAHHYGSQQHANATLWTSWWCSGDRSHHQLIVFDPVTQQAQKCIPFHQLLKDPSAQLVYDPSQGKYQQKTSVRFACDNGIVQEPLMLYSPTAHRLYIVHQVESQGRIAAAVSVVVPHSPYAVVDTLKLPFPFCKENASVVARITIDDSKLFVISEKLHCLVIEISNQLRVVRCFRSRDFQQIASSVPEALAASISWSKAESEGNVILPEYFLDPSTNTPIPEPKRFQSKNGSAVIPSSSASQRSVSAASTVPQRMRDQDEFQPRASAATPSADRIMATMPQLPTSFVAAVLTKRPPPPGVIVKAINAMAGLQRALLMSRYFSQWTGKMAKHPSWCIDGWSRANQPVVMIPLNTVVGLDGKVLSSFLRTCHEAQVEVWLSYNDRDDIGATLAILKACDTFRVVGQVVALPTLKGPQYIYLRHVPAKSILLVFSSVGWMTQAQCFGLGEKPLSFAVCQNKIYAAAKHNHSEQLAFLQNLASLIYACYRSAPKNNLSLWEALRSESVEVHLGSVKECAPDGRTFVDLVAL